MSHWCYAVSWMGFMLERHTTCWRRDGSVKYTVFDKCAVSICVEEGVGHRRMLVLQLVPRGRLTEAERAA